MSATTGPAGLNLRLPRVLITDDEAPARARLRDLLADVAADFPHVLVDEAASGDALMEWLAHDAQQGANLIVLLDVEMPGMSGLEAARKLQDLEPAPIVIFVTAFDGFALGAFEVRAIDYLLKPVRAARLLDALQRTLPLLPSAGETLQPTAPGIRPFVTIHERGRVLKVAVEEIVYLKAELKYVTIRTAAHQYLSEEALGTFENSFPEVFVRVHRNTLVARKAIAGFARVQAGKDQDQEYDGAGEPYWEVLLHGLEERLPISRRQWPLVKSLLKGPGGL